jgi:hypothetical protein
MVYGLFESNMAHEALLSSLTHELIFSGESQYTHATQDTNHGAPQSQRETITD